MFKTAIKYTIFAGIATLVNLGTQYIALRIYHWYYPLYFAILAGTFTGLIVKYILDKKFIFYYRVQTKTEDVKKFVLYSLMGVVTTVIFWGSELLFHYLLKTHYAKYIGGALGLAIGYTTKYFLDKKFVFRNRKEN